MWFTLLGQVEDKGVFCDCCSFVGNKWVARSRDAIGISGCGTRPTGCWKATLLSSALRRAQDASKQQAAE